MTARAWFPSLLIAAVFLIVPSSTSGQGAPDPAAIERALRHQTKDWQAIAPHLPDPVTGSAASLEMAADVLRARRLPEDALEYYEYALKRGGDPEELLNRIGVTELELRHPDYAQAAFRRILLLNRRDAEAWNNLGAAEYVTGNFASAISDYKHAIKLERKAATFHSNLGTAYFERGDYDSARQQFEAAVKIDPKVFEQGGWSGVQAHVLSPKDRGRFCFEMAKLAARHGDDEGTIRWLSKASEAGFDVLHEMRDDREFDAYKNDPRVALLVQNAHAMRNQQIAASGLAPALPAEPAKVQ